MDLEKWLRKRTSRMTRYNAFGSCCNVYPAHRTAGLQGSSGVITARCSVIARHWVENGDANGARARGMRKRSAWYNPAHENIQIVLSAFSRGVLCPCCDPHCSASWFYRAGGRCDHDHESQPRKFILTAIHAIKSAVGWRCD